MAASADWLDEYSVDSGPLLEFLMRRDPDSVPQGFLQSLEGYLSEDRWLTSYESVRYNDMSTYRNLFNSEMQRDFRNYLESQGVSVEDYAGILGPVQYNVVRAQLKAVFPDRNGTKGWKLVLQGFPSLQLVVLALGHHFGDARSQKNLGEASERLRPVAVAQLSDELVPLVEGYPAARPADWDDSGLMPSPVLAIGSLDISTYDSGSGAKLRFVRNTSAKKEISTFFLRHSMQASQFHEALPAELGNNNMSQGDYHLALVRQMAREIGKSAK